MNLSRYVPPDPCQCYSTVKINGFFAISERNSLDDIEMTPVVERGPAFAGVSGRRDDKSLPVGAPGDGWATYRGGISRSGSTECGVPGKLRVKWEAEIGESITAPVIAEDKVFVAERDAYTVHCLNRETGRQAWRFLANGPVDTPPTIYKGLCVFGCGDGSVYCLDAESGEFAWRFKTATLERRVGSEDRLESPLRVHGAVLVQNNVVYFVAGRSSNLDGGIRVYGLDVWTGKQLHGRTLVSAPNTRNGSLADVLVSDGDTISMRQVRLTRDLKPRGKAGGLVASTGFLDATWFHRQDWRMGRLRGQLVVQGRTGTYSVVNPYTGLKQRRKGQYGRYNQVGHFHQKFTRYKEEFFLIGTTITARLSAAARAGGSGGKGAGGRGTWSINEKFQPRAMVLAGERLYLAGWLDDMPIAPKTGRPKDPRDPDAHRSVLRVYSAGTGKRISETALESDPVFDGIGAAYGNLFVSLKNGKLVCMGE